METVRTSQPEIADLLKPLQVNASRLIGVGESLDQNVAALREKIELAREQANRVRDLLIMMINKISWYSARHFRLKIISVIVT